MQRKVLAVAGPLTEGAQPRQLLQTSQGLRARGRDSARARRALKAEQLTKATHVLPAREITR